MQKFSIKQAITGREYGKYGLVLLLYSSLLSLVFFYLYVNPNVGRDYQSYLYIIEKIIVGEYFREPGFSVVALVLSFCGFDAELVVYLFRVACLSLLARFFYYSPTPVVGVLVFVLTPNIMIGTFNALQTWLSIAIFSQYFCSRLTSASGDERVIWFALAASLFHIAGLLYVIVVLCVFFQRRFGFGFVFVVGVVVTPIVSHVFTELISYLGFTKYLIPEKPVTLFALSLSTLMVFGLFLMARIAAGRYKELMYAIGATYFFVSLSMYYFGIESQVYLRMLNYILLPLYFSFSVVFSHLPLFIRVPASILLAIILIANFIQTILSLPVDMLNFSQLRALF